MKKEDLNKKLHKNEEKEESREITQKEMESVTGGGMHWKFTGDVKLGSQS